MATSKALDVRQAAERRAGPRLRRSSRGRQRFALALSLVILALSAIYSSISVLARVYPALFPGQTLASTIGLTRVLAPLPGLGSVEELKAESAFNNRINVLILGLDQRPQDPTAEGHLTDMIIVASLDPLAKRVNFLSFPRDLWVEIHLDDDDPYNFYNDRINSSFRVGFERGGTREAVKQVQRDLYWNFGVSTDYWVVLDFRGVERLVDALGGIDVDIPPDLAVPSWWYSDDDVNARWIAFPAGPQHLDGYSAVAFGRYRNDSDLRRVKRQQLVLEAAVGRVFSLGLLNDPAGLWDAYSSTVTTDMSKARMLGLVPLFRETQGRTAMYSLGDPVNGVQTVTEFVTETGLEVLAWDRDNVRYWLDKAFPKVKYLDSSVEIQDATGSGDDSTATALARYLLFYRNLPTVNLGPVVPAEEYTRIELYGDRVELAEDLRAWLGVPPGRLGRHERDPALHQPDVVIVIGADFVLPDS